MLNKQTLQKLNEFLNIEGKKYLYYHRDQDGVCSAALLMKFYPGFTAITKRGPRFTKEALETLISRKPEVVVFLDLPVDQEQKSLDRLHREIPYVKIVIIDHHIYEKNMNSEAVIHINPLFRRKVYQSTSYLVYNILKKMVGNKVKRFVWIAMMGAIGDYDLSNSGDLVKECRKSYPNLLGKDPHNSRLSRGSRLLSAIITLKNWKGAGEALETLLNADMYDDFSGVRKFKAYQKEVDREFERVIESAKMEEYEDCKLLVFWIESDLSMVSNVSNFFSGKYPDRIIIVRKASGPEWKLSVRYQAGKINLGKLMKKTVKGLGTGGGHPKAAAGIVKDWEKFRKRLLNNLRKA